MTARSLYSEENRHANAFTNGSGVPARGSIIAENGASRQNLDGIMKAPVVNCRASHRARRFGANYDERTSTSVYSHT